nr:MAG: proline dehydrogenase [Chloroflexota bacterium]
MMRQTLLYLAERPSLKQLFGSPLARPLVRRFVAGETRADALAAVERLNSAGIAATLDFLGESVRDAEAARAAAEEYVALLQAIDAHRLNSNISLKLTQLGLDIDRELCRANLLRVVRQAAELDCFVRIDMESSAYTQVTLDLFEEIYASHRNVGVVIQAYLYRSAADVRRLNQLGARVRLCKGAYNEPASVAFPKKADTDRNYIALMQELLREGNYPAIATHDEHMIEATRAFAERSGIGAERFEFQMLYGVRRDLQERLVRDGYRVRAYVPYGDQWYPYFMRRLAERPANLLFVLGGVLRER